MSICEKYQICGSYNFNSMTCNERGISPSCGIYKHLGSEEIKKERKSKKTLGSRILNIRL